MDLERLNAAALEGNTETLNHLLQEDPFILDKVSLKCWDMTTTRTLPLPLHIAVVLGHVNFVRAIMRVCSDMCLARDSDGRNPLHLAAIKGRIQVLEILIQYRPLAAREKTDRGETVLHLCVKYNQLEALKMIVEQMKDSEFLNAKNNEGMTILHLAVLAKQIETVKFLVENEIDVKAKDGNGKTALNICGEVTNTEIRTLLQNSGIRTDDEKIDDHPNQGNNWLAKKRDAIMVVASLITTMAFQAGVNPPGGVWQDDLIVSSSDRDSPPSHKAGEAVMAYSHNRSYKYFIRANTIAFVSSLSTTLLLISGLPFRRRLFMWFLMAEMWLTITAIALTYGISVVIVTPKYDRRQTLGRVIEVAVIVWCCVMSLLLLGNTIRLINRWLRARRTRRLSPGNSPV